MPVPNIQNNKYTPGPLPEPAAPRHELLARMDQRAGTKLVYICAPAGSGKTVSALLWMKKSGRRPVWVGLDSYDNSVSIFYRMFCAGVLSAQPDNARMTEILQSPAFYSAPVEHTIMLLSEFSPGGDEYVLALDDFHTITDREILKSLPFILRRLPHSFCTLILSRNGPGQDLSEYMDSVRAAVIGADDLCFDAKEIKDYFEIRGRRIEAPEADAVFEFTGGWAGFVSAAAVAYGAGSAPRELDRLLRDGIEKLMWSRWDEDARAFLIASAAVDEAPVRLCEKITGNAGAGALLENLRAQNAFVTRAGDGVYRYHPLFLDFLRALPEYAEADKKDAWREAAVYYANKGDLTAAAQYACKSGNIETILDTLSKYMAVSEIPVYDNTRRLKALLFNADYERLCEECPVLYEPLVYLSFSAGDAPRLEKYTDKLKSNLPVILAGYPKFAEAAVSVTQLDHRAPLAEQAARLDELPSVVFEDYEIRRPTYSFQMPFLHRGSRDFYELTDKKVYDGWIKSNKRILKNNFEPVVHSISAGLYLEQNRVNEALSEAQAAAVKLEDGTAKEIRFSVYMHDAAACLAAGNEAEFATLTEKTEAFINGDAAFLLPNFLAFTVRVKLWDGDETAAREWLEHDFASAGALIEPYRLYQHFTTIRAHAVLGEPEKAKALALRVRKTGRDFCRPQDAAEAGVLLAAVLWSEGKKEESREMMETVLSETQPYSFIRLIADEGAAVLQVLRKVNRKTERADYQGPLDPIYVNSVYIAAYTVSKQRKGVMAEFEKNSVKLSRQQKMILRLLAQGYKRKDIADKTGLSHNTIKSHTRLVYEKLGAGSAVDAVVKARELGVIE